MTFYDTRYLVNLFRGQVYAGSADFSVGFAVPGPPDGDYSSIHVDSSAVVAESGEITSSLTIVGIDQFAERFVFDISVGGVVESGTGEKGNPNNNHGRHRDA